jgi:protein-S-isoprenylcysteine O-methyltransferase Ste14
MSMNKRLVRGTVSVFYLLIGLEIVIMISPFAAYFYSVYGPLLNFLYGHEITAWLTGFFLPHAAVTKSVLLNSLGGLGRVIFTFGIIAFLIGAVQIYSAKLRRKGLVKTLFYGRIRHPQYLFIAIAGLGPSAVFIYRHSRSRAIAILAPLSDPRPVYQHAVCLLFAGTP